MYKRRSPARIAKTNIVVKYQEVKETPLQKAITAYRFICGDLEEGLNYMVSVELYNKSMEGIESQLRTNGSVTARKFAEDFWREWQKRERAK